MKVLWSVTTEAALKQLKRGVDFFEIEHDLYKYLCALPTPKPEWIGLTTKKGKCQSKKTDYIFLRIIGFEESTEGDSFYMKLKRGVCGECRHFKDMDCTHPGSTLCDCFLFFMPEEIGES